MKIVFLTRRFYPHIGGVEKHIFKVSQELIRRGHTVFVVSEHHDSLAPDYSEHLLDGIQVHFFNFGPPGPSKKFRIWITLWKHRRLFQQADIVHTHDTMFWYVGLNILIKPGFATFHGDEKVFPPARKAVFIRKLCEWVARGTIDVGPYLRKWYGTRPTTTIVGAVDKPYSLPNGKTRRSTPRILLIGRLEPDISISIYKDILTKLRQQKFPFTFEVCGDGTARNELQPFGKLHGFVHKVEPFVHKADIVFASSYLAILEALSQYKPVVAIYENPMKKDYLSKTSFAKWICITDSVEDAARYISKKGPKGFSQKTQREIHTYISNTTWKNITDQYEKLWKALS